MTTLPFQRHHAARWLARSLIIVVALLLNATQAMAQAVRINPDGVGQGLIYPYYAARNGWATLMSVVNRDLTAAKALRVRFIEGRNGAIVASLNLFLSAGEVWTAAIVPASGDSPGPRLVSADQSCVGGPPELIRGPQVQLAFSSQNYRNDTDVAALQSLDRSGEGYIEVIEIGRLRPESRLFQQVVRRNFGALPPICDTVRDSDMVLYGEEYLRVPSGGLSGAATLLHIAGGMSAEYAATAIDHLSIDAANLSRFVTPSGHALPSLASGDNKVADVHVGGQRRTLTFSSAIDAVSATMMSVSIAGEYAFTDDGAIRTAWAVAAPTRRHYMQGNLSAGPFSRSWDRSQANACEYAEFDLSFDREGRGGGYDDFAVRPSIPDEGICFHTTVLSFARTHVDGLFGSNNRYRFRYLPRQDGESFPTRTGREGGYGLLHVGAGAGLRSQEGWSVAVGANGDIGVNRENSRVLDGLPLVAVGVSTASYLTGNPQQNFANGVALESGRSLRNQ